MQHTVTDQQLDTTINQLARESLRLARPDGDPTLALFCTALMQMVSVLKQLRSAPPNHQ